MATLAANDPVAKVSQARAHVARREWDKAVQCYAEAMELEPTNNGDIWFEFAAAQLLAGDRPGYRQTCAHMLARCQGKAQIRAYLAARACTLAAHTEEVSAKIARYVCEFQLSVRSRRGETDNLSVASIAAA